MDVTASSTSGQLRCSAAAAADDQGRFRIELTGDPETEEGQVVLVATAPNCGFAAKVLTDLNVAIEEPVRLAVEQPVDVRLVDLEGSPIVGAEIRPADVYSTKGSTNLASHMLSHDLLPPLSQKWTSDRDGRFTMRGCGPDHTAYLEVQAPGFGKQHAKLEIKTGSGTAVLTLGSAGGISRGMGRGLV